MGTGGEGDHGRVGPFRSFAGDLRRVGRVWRRDPRLPATVVAIACVTQVWALLTRLTDIGAFGLVGLIATIYFVGFSGANLVWCVRVDRGAMTPTHSVLQVIRGLRWRYFRLYVVIGLVAAVPTIAMVAVAPDDAMRSFGLGAIIGVVSALLAFAPAGLAFDDVRARDAARHSLGVLRREWPTCALYVLAPIVAIVAMGPIRLAADGAWGVFILGVIFAVVRALLDGTIALFYADRYPTVRGGDATLDADLRESRSERRRGAAAPAPMVTWPPPPPHGRADRVRPHTPGPRGHDQPLRAVPGEHQEVRVWKEMLGNGWQAHCRICGAWDSGIVRSERDALAAFLQHRSAAHADTPRPGAPARIPGAGIPLRREVKGGSVFRPPEPPAE